MEEVPFDEDAVDETITPLSFFFPEVTEEEARKVDGETAIIMERRCRVMALYRQRRTMQEIASALKCGIGTVHRDIHAVLEGYKRIAARTTHEHLVDELQRIAHREADTEREWERSKGELVETSASKRNKFDATSVKKKQRVGDPRLMSLLLKWTELRCKLLGLLKPDNDAAANDAAMYLKVLDMSEVSPTPQ